jgi:PKD repeat protein
VHLGAAVTPSDAPVIWDFGDGTTGRGLSVSHVFGGPGVYTVTASATDSADNETVVTRDITVTAATVGGPGPGTPAPVVVPPPARAAAVAVAAALKVAKATRNGAKVTVSGTISSRAKGKVTIAYAQKVGHATVSVKKTATVAKGRWSVVLTLPRSLSRGSAARGKATVTFAGTAAVKRATAKRTVSIAKAKKKAPAHKRRG